MFNYGFKHENRKKSFFICVEILFAPPFIYAEEKVLQFSEASSRNMDEKKRKRRADTPLSNEFLTNNDPFTMRSKNNRAFDL